MIDWEAIAEETALALEEAGAEGAIIRFSTSGPAYNPTRSNEPPKPCKVMFDEWRDSEVDGTNVLRSDLKVLIANDMGFAPTTEDTFEFGGQQYSIEDVKPVAPAGVAVLYQLQCRL